MRHFVSLILLFVSLSFATDTLNVAVSPATPMVMKQGQEIVGFDIDVWDNVADQMNVHTNFIYIENFSDMFEMVKNGSADVALGAITITESREADFDFAYPYKNSGMTILIRNEAEADVMGAVAQIWNGSFRNIWLIFIALALLAAHAIWFAERGSPSFDDRYRQGIWESIWYIVVTVTTVGYGDKVPAKAFSKVIAVAVMLVGIGVAGLAISQLSAIMNVQMVHYAISSPSQLEHKRVAVVVSTTSQLIAPNYGVIPVETKTIEEAVLMLQAKKVDAVIFDAPILQYIALKESDVVTVGGVFEPEDYGFLLKHGSTLREPITKAILKMTQDGTRQELESKWFGTGD